VSQQPPWTQSVAGVLIDVRLTPRGGRDAIEGIERRADGRAVVKARVQAPPMEGAANEAVCKLFADAVGVAPRQVAIAAGATARIKRLRITGDTHAVAAKLDRLFKAEP